MSVSTMETQSTEELSLALLNINGLRDKIPDIRHIISRDKVHVFALCETKLDASVADSKVYIPGFRMWRKDRKETEGGGVALYVQDHIKAKERTDLMETTVEIIWVEMEIPDSTPVLLGCCYRPPSAKAEYKNRIYDNMKLVSEEEKHIFLMGDFNIDWIKIPQKMKTTLSECGLKQIVEDPTRLKEKTETCIDHIYTNAAHLCGTPESRVTGCSDHNLITVTVKIKIPKRVRRLRSNQDFNLETFRADVKRANWNAVSEESNPKKALRMLTKKFLSIADKNTSIQTIDIYDLLKLDKELEDLIRERDQAEGCELTKSKNKLVNRFEMKQKIYFRQNLQKGKNDPKKILKVFEWVLGESLPSYVINIKKEEPVTSKVEHLDPCCQTYTGTKDLKSIFEGSAGERKQKKRTCSFSFKKGSAGVRKKRKRTCSFSFKKGSAGERKKKKRTRSFSFKEIDAETVKRLLEHLCDHVTHGINETEAKLLKRSADDISAPICHILNRCINSNTFPSELKEFMRIPSSLNNMTQLRDVNSLHIMLGWILDIVLFLQAKQHFIDEGLIPSASVKDEINQIKSAWLKATAERKIVQAVFLDFSSSFDTISHDLLKKKLKTSGFSLSACSLIKRFLSFGQGPHGLPRGSLLSQLLFTVFIKSLLRTSSAVICDGCVMVYCVYGNETELGDIVKSVSDQAARFNISPREPRAKPVKTMYKDIFDILQSLYRCHQEQLNWIRALRIIMDNYGVWYSNEILEKLEECFTETLLKKLSKEVRESALNSLQLSRSEFRTKGRWRR